MEFELTPRIALFFKRVLTIEADNIQEQFKKYTAMDEEIFRDNINDDDDCNVNLMTRSFNSFSIKITCEYHFDDEDNIEMDQLYIQVEIKYKNQIIDIRVYEKDKMNDWLDSLIKVYQSCKCNKKLAKLDGWCHTCYPYVIEQDDNCCCCLQNEGVWLKLSCGHKLHSYCWEQVQNLKCPMCRNKEKHHYGFDMC